MAWSKIKFYYDSIPGSLGSAITATSAAAGSSVENIYNMMEVNTWVSSDAASPQYITVDLGAAGPARSADYLAVLGHNLFSAGASVTLQRSTDGAVYSDALAPFVPLSDKIVLKEFAQTGEARYWRLKLDGMSAPVRMAVCIWGLRTELDYASASFDPNTEEAMASVNLSYGGYLTGIHTQYVERSMSLRFDDADEPLFGKLRQWREKSGVGNFFVGWETAGRPDEVFLMRPEMRFYNPLRSGGLYRDVIINLTGRKE